MIFCNCGKWANAINAIRAQAVCDAVLGPAVVVVQDVFEECGVWDGENVVAAVGIRAAWKDGKAHDLFA